MKNVLKHLIGFVIIALIAFVVQLLVRCIQSLIRMHRAKIDECDILASHMTYACIRIDQLARKVAGKDDNLYRGISRHYHDDFWHQIDCMNLSSWRLTRIIASYGDFYAFSGWHLGTDDDEIDDILEHIADFLGVKRMANFVIDDMYDELKEQYPDKVTDDICKYDYMLLDDETRERLKNHTDDDDEDDDDENIWFIDEDE